MATKHDKDRIAAELAAGGEKVSGEAIEQIVKRHDALEEELAKDPIPAQYVAGPEPQQEAVVGQFAQAEIDRRRIVTLEEQILELQELVKKIARDRGGYDKAIEVINEQDQAREERERYKRIQAQGDEATITIHTHPDPAQNYPVLVSVNGRRWNIRRGVPTIVPSCVVEVLDHAKVRHISREVDDAGNPVSVPHDYLMYPYTLVDYGRVHIPGRAA